MSVAIITDGGAEEKNKAFSRAYMLTDTQTMQSRVVAELMYKGKLFRCEVPLEPGKGNVEALQEALDDVRKQAKAVQLTDFFTMERIR